MALEENRRLFKHNTNTSWVIFIANLFFLKCNLDHILFIFIHSVIKCKFQRSPILRLHGPPVRPRPHVSGDFCIRKFFYADTKISASTRSVYESYTTVHTYPIRIRTSQRISQQSMRITSAYTKIYGYERPHVSGYTAYTEISTLESVYRNLRTRVDRAWSFLWSVACMQL